MKRSFSLFEVLLTIVIISIVFYNSVILANDLYTKNSASLNETISKLELNTTYLFIQKNLDGKYKFLDKKLFYGNSLLLDNVIIFNENRTDRNLEIDICIKKNIEVCQKWEFKI